MWSLAAELVILALAISVSIVIVSIVLGHSGASATVCSLARCMLNLSDGYLQVKVVDLEKNIIVEYAYIYIYNYTQSNFTVLRVYTPISIRVSNLRDSIILVLTPVCFNYTGSFYLTKPIYVTPCGIYNNSKAIPANCEPVVQCLGSRCWLIASYKTSYRCYSGGEKGLIWLGKLVKIVIRR